MKEAHFKFEGGVCVVEGKMRILLTEYQILENKHVKKCKFDFSPLMTTIMLFN